MAEEVDGDYCVSILVSLVRANWFDSPSRRCTDVHSYSTFASSMIAPGREQIQQDLNISRTVSVVPFSIFSLGVALGSVVGSPASEQWGRQPVFRISMSLLLIFVMGSGFSHDLASLLVCRFLGGFGGSASLTLASATISDLYEPGPKRGAAMFCYYSMPWFGSVLAPFLGYLIVAGKMWPWTQWVYLFIAAPIVVCGLFFLNETKQSALDKKAEREENPRAATSRRSKREIVATVRRAAMDFVRTSLLRPLKMLFTELIVFLVCMYSGFLFGLTYALVIVFPDVFRKTYGFDYTQQGLCFLGMIVGCFLGGASLLLDNHILRDQSSDRLESMGSVESLDEKHKKPVPERRLHGAMLGSVLLPIGLIWFAWTARSGISFLSPIFASVLIAWGSLTIYASSSTYILDVYGPRYGASANGANSITRYTMAGAVPLFILQMYDGLGTGWATSILALCALIMMPIPFCFARWGPQLRARCRFKTDA